MRNLFLINIFLLSYNIHAQSTDLNKIYFEELIKEINCELATGYKTNIDNKKEKDKYYLKIFLNNYGVFKHINTYFDPNNIDINSAKQEWEKLRDDIEKPEKINKYIALKIAFYIYENLREKFMIDWLKNYKGNIKNFLQSLIPYYFVRLVDHHFPQKDNKTINIRNQNKALFFINLLDKNTTVKDKKEIKNPYYKGLYFIGVGVSQGEKDNVKVNNDIFQQYFEDKIYENIDRQDEIKFHSTEYTRVDDLKGIKNDLEFGAGTLRSLGYEGITLLNKQATAKSIKENIENLVLKANGTEKKLNKNGELKKNLIILFYSAHGLEETKNIELNLKTYQTNSYEPKAITFKELVGYFDGLKDANVLIVLDTCFSGEAESDIGKLNLNNVNNVNIMVAAAAAKNKETPEIISVTNKDVGKFSYKFFHTLISCFTKENKVSVSTVLEKITNQLFFKSQGTKCFKIFGKRRFTLESHRPLPEQVNNVLTYSI